MSEDISPSHDEFFKNMMGRVAIARKYTANWYNFTFLVPHPNPPPLGEGVYEKRRLCQFAVYFERSMTEFLLTAEITEKIFNEIMIFFAFFASLL